MKIEKVFLDFFLNLFLKFQEFYFIFQILKNFLSFLYFEGPKSEC
jgi:hypothetical protein